MSFLELAEKHFNVNNNNSKSPVVPPKRRSKLGFTSDKKIADDEFMAAAIGDTEWLRQSLRNTRGAINYDKNGLTPIHLASIHGRLDCLRLLVDKLKVDVNLASTTGWRPVHLVVSNQTGKRAFHCLSYLLTKGGDPSIANEDGITPMHQAASEGHVQCMKALIDVGARIDAEDCRGHKPIDLAKLWGHKKCARILAAEMWHRDKDFIAREMRQLQKVKMQQVLLEIEQDEENRADQQFYGDLAFNQWLDARNLPKKPVGPPSQQKAAVEALPSSSRGPRSGRSRGEATSARDSLHRANSLQTPASRRSRGGEDREGKKGLLAETPAGLEAGEAAGDDAPTEEGGEREPQERAKTRATEVKFVEPPKEDEKSEEKPEGEEAKQEKKQPSFINPVPWNKSPKTPVPEYVKILPDHYPRDVYTMMPKHPAVRQRKVAPRSPASGAPSGQAGTEGSPLRMPQLPADIIDKALGREAAKKDRPVVYNCQNIIDVQARQHYDPDRDPVPRGEVGLHLTNQLDSHLFQAALHREPIPVTPSTAISSLLSRSSSSTGSSTVRSGGGGGRTGQSSVRRAVSVVSLANERLVGSVVRSAPPQATA